MVSKTQTHRVGRNSSSIAGAICDFRQSRLRRSSKLSSPYTESNEQLVSSIKKMMKMNYRYLISDISHSRHGMDAQISAVTWDILLASFQLDSYVPRTQLVANFRPCVWSGSLILLVRSLETNSTVHIVAEKHSLQNIFADGRL